MVVVRKEAKAKRTLRMRGQVWQGSGSSWVLRLRLLGCFESTDGKSIGASNIQTPCYSTKVVSVLYAKLGPRRLSL